MKQLDLISGVFWIFFSFLAALESFQLRLGSFQRPGPGFLPFGAACFLGIFSIVVFMQAILAEKEITKKEGWREAKGWPKAVFVLAVLFGYTLSLEKLGFLITTLLLLLVLLKTIEPQSWRKTIILSCLGSFLSYFIFNTCLKVPLPSGLINNLGF